MSQQEKTQIAEFEKNFFAKTAIQELVYLMVPQNTTKPNTFAEQITQTEKILKDKVKAIETLKEVYKTLNTETLKEIIQKDANILARVSQISNLDVSNLTIIEKEGNKYIDGFLTYTSASPGIIPNSSNEEMNTLMAEQALIKQNSTFKIEFETAIINLTEVSFSAKTKTSFKNENTEDYTFFGELAWIFGNSSTIGIVIPVIPLNEGLLPENFTLISSHPTLTTKIANANLLPAWVLLNDSQKLEWMEELLADYDEDDEDFVEEPKRLKN